MSLQVRQLSKEYATRSGPLPVLRDVDFEMKRGDALAVMGPSGSGKSTLLHILGTLDRPSAGSVTLAGKDPFALSEAELADFRNRNVGFIFQDHHLLPQCSVLENVLIPTLVGDGAQEQWARELLHRVGLSQRLDHRPAELSGANGSASPSPARSFTVPHCCSPMSRPAISIARRPRRWRSYSLVCTSRSKRCWWWSRTRSWPSCSRNGPR